MAKYKKRETTIEILKRFYVNTPNSDTVTLEQIFIGVGRDLSNETTNRNWLSNVLTHIRHYELITPVYSYNKHKRILSGVKLTKEGLKMLGRVTENVGTVPPVSSPEKTKPSIELGPSLYELFHSIAKFKKENPDYEVDFNVKLKSSSV